MTIKEKIADLSFYNLIAKLKDILGIISTKFDTLTGRVSKLEKSSSSGGSQDLQSVLEVGNVVTGDTSIVFQESGTDRILSLSGIDVSLEAEDTGTEVGLNIFEDEIGFYPVLKFASNGLFSELQMNREETIEGESSKFLLPKSYPEGEPFRVLATLDDITNLTLDDIMLEGNNSIAGKNIRLNSLDGTTGNQIQAEQINLFNNTGYNNYITPTNYSISYNDGSSQVSTFMNKTQFGFNNNDYNASIQSPSLTEPLLWTLPSHSGILATLYDILNPILETYADNASAIIGGLPVGRQYKTATGELRIVV